MKIVVLSNSNKYENEEMIVSEMFKQGLQHFHLRKPRLSKSAIKTYLDAIPKEHHNKIILHSKHTLANTYNVQGIHLTKKHRTNYFKTWWTIRLIKLKNPNIIITTSFHSLETLTENTKKFEYVFLSPVFDSISKNNYSGKFNDSNLKMVFCNLKTKVIALGGVNIEKIEQVMGMGFDGMALLGGIWKSGNPITQFINIKEECERKNLSLA